MKKRRTTRTRRRTSWQEGANGGAHHPPARLEVVNEPLWKRLRSCARSGAATNNNEQEVVAQTTTHWLITHPILSGGGQAGCATSSSSRRLLLWMRPFRGRTCSDVDGIVGRVGGPPAPGIAGVEGERARAEEREGCRVAGAVSASLRSGAARVGGAGRGGRSVR